MESGGRCGCVSGHPRLRVEALEGSGSRWVYSYVTQPSSPRFLVDRNYALTNAHNSSHSYIYQVSWNKFVFSNNCHSRTNYTSESSSLTASTVSHGLGFLS